MNTIIQGDPMALSRTRSEDGTTLKRSKSISKIIRTPPQVNRYRRPSRRNHALKLNTAHRSTPLLLRNGIYEDFSEHEFSFDDLLPTSSPFTSSSDLDLESLPDTEESTPTTSPLCNKRTWLSLADIRPSRNPSVSILDRLNIAYREQTGPSIFEIPEIVHKIIEYVDIRSTIVPQEGSLVRRKPLSYNHAMLIYGNEKDAQEAMKKDSLRNNGNTAKLPKGGCLHSLLLVNKLFHLITMEFIHKKFFFSCEVSYMKYLHVLQSKSSIYKNYDSSFSPQSNKSAPSLFVLHKLYLVKQSSFDIISEQISFKKLKWLELYLCPKLLPPVSVFESSVNLQKFIVTGSKILDDQFIIKLLKKCPNLEVLDIRACELVSDSSIYSIGKYCHKLTTVNLGRKNKGHLITDSSILMLVKNNPKLNTIGLAGCAITDRVLWEIAIICNFSLERLSLNNCALITNQSIPLILHSNYLPNLSVLELRFVDQLTNFLPIIEFKRRQQFKGISILIEACESLCLKMNEQERKMDQMILKRIFRDILEWVHDPDDDVSHHTLIRNRNN